MALHYDPLPEIRSTTTMINDKRHYRFADGVGPFPSITTVLSDKAKPQLEKWKKRVGETEAARVSAAATKNGSRIHEMCEARVTGKPFPRHSFIDRSRLKLFEDKFFKDVQRVYLLEAAVYHLDWRAAGRLDFLLDYKSRLAIADIKTANRPRKREWIEDYFCQGAFYARSVNQRYPELPTIEDMHIVMLVGDADVEIFTESVASWAPKVEQRIADYWKKHPKVVDTEEKSGVS